MIISQLKVLLASASPRRADLLRQAGVGIEIFPADVDEGERAGESPRELAERLALTKARHVANGRSSGIVLGADTVVAIKEQSRAGSFMLLGKPGNAARTREMLMALSGREHVVITGFCLIDAGMAREVFSSVQTIVTFRTLSDADIQRYVATTEPFDKAGGYAIQGGAAGFVRRISGSYTNVVGLPVAEVLDMLASMVVDERL